MLTMLNFLSRERIATPMVKDGTYLKFQTCLDARRPFDFNLDSFIMLFELLKNKNKNKCQKFQGLP